MTSDKYKLLVIDIDGTLINNEGNISEENREALAMARNAGIQVALSTGRSVKSCLRYLEELPLDSYHIFFDGGLVSCPATEECIYVQHLEAEAVRQLVEFARETNANIEITSVNNYYSERETWSTHAKREFFGVETTIGSLAGIWEREQIIRADLFPRTSAAPPIKNRPAMLTPPIKAIMFAALAGVNPRSMACWTMCMRIV